MRLFDRRKFLLIAGSTLTTGGLAGSHAYEALFNSHADAAITRSTRALGTEVRLTAVARSPENAHRAIAAAFAELAFVERLMSLYRPDSQLSTLNRTGLLIDPHPYLLQVLRYSQEVSARTSGAFDITVQPLWETFASAAQQDQLPSVQEIAAAREKVDWQQVAISEAAVVLQQPGMKITLNGIAQGFAADCVQAALRTGGIEHALADAGELMPLGHSPRGGPWRVGIQHPRHADAHIAFTDLNGRALATSGDYATRFTTDLRHHHILDPRTGYSPTELSNVSILAPTALEADALSTACFVLGPERSLKLLKGLPGVDAFFVLKDDETIATSGFPLRHEGSAG